MSPHVHVVATTTPDHRRLLWLAVLVAWLAGGAP